jgi:hypothetical protein
MPGIGLIGWYFVFMTATVAGLVWLAMGCV